MKALIIDSHKGSDKLPSNLHTLNAKVLADKIGADLIWSYPNVNDNIESNHDVIVFNHASHNGCSLDITNRKKYKKATRCTLRKR